MADIEDYLSKIFSKFTDTDVLVGGRSLLLWAKLLNVDIPDTDEPLTKDIDVLTDFENSIKFLDVSNVIRKPDERQFNSILFFRAKFSKNTHADFISRINGVSRSSIIKAAQKIIFDDFSIQIIHPVHLLESKLSNVLDIESKRDFSSICQAELSIQISKKYISGLIADNDHSLAIRSVEEILKFLKENKKGERLKEFSLNGYQAIPINELNKVNIPNFVDIRLPRILKEFKDELSYDVTSFKNNCNHSQTFDPK